MTSENQPAVKQSALSAEQLKQRWVLPQYPRASAHDPQWAIDNAMGPNVLWLAEWLTQSPSFELTRGMRILDLGCGRAASAIFLAREFEVTVFAADLWIKPTENHQRIAAAGLSDRVFPLHLEAHAMPFADGYFDAIVSFDAYHYFGTDDLYIAYAARFLRPGGVIGIVVPGLVKEFPGDVPQHLLPYWDWEFCSFHSAAWWRRHWDKTGRVKVDAADFLPDGWRQWQQWNLLRADAVPDAQRHGLLHEAKMLEVDAGRNLGFTRVVATRSL